MTSPRDNYDDALKEFETLTNARAATLRNKGKEQGVAKLSVLFKQGKSLDQRLDDWQRAVLALEKAREPAAILKGIKAIQVARDKLNEGLKKNIADFTAQGKEISP